MGAGNRQEKGKGWGNGRGAAADAAREPDADLRDQIAGELHRGARVAVAEVREDVDLDLCSGLLEPNDAHAILVCGDGVCDILSDFFEQSLPLGWRHFVNVDVHDQQ